MEHIKLDTCNSSQQWGSRSTIVQCILQYLNSNTKVQVSGICDIQIIKIMLNSSHDSIGKPPIKSHTINIRMNIILDLRNRSLDSIHIIEFAVFHKLRGGMWKYRDTVI